MKKLVFAIVFINVCVFSYAQNQVTGVVKDANNGSPIPYATAALLRSDSTAVTGVITGNDGKFVIEKVAAGDYLLQVSFIGYNKEYRRVNVPAQSDLGDISLAESATRMQEVVVSAARPLVAMRADRYVVNVSGNIQSAGRDAMDILRNTPGLLVSQKGDISVLGNSVQVWIDGRPSRMTGEQLQAFLASMQGGEIDRIEVITNPSSRYEAEGAGGIIDIRTKKGLQFGVNGTITAGYRQGRQDRENAGVSMNWRREKFNMFGNYSFNRTNNWEKISQINVMQATDSEITFDQNTTTKSTEAGLRHNMRAGMDYFINPKNILGLIVTAYHSDNGTTAVQGFTDISPTHNGVSHSTADNIRSGNSDGIQVNMNYQSTFDKPGQQLNFDLDYARFFSKPFQKNANGYFDSNDAMINGIEQLRNTNPQTIDVYSAKIDYTQPLWKDARMETGAKIGQSKTDNDLKYDEFIGNDWQTDLDRTNRFVYTEQISAAYININQQLGKINLQAGLRGEYTQSKGEQKTTGEVNETSYFDLFPTFFVNYRASQKHNLGLSYSRRLSRPSYGYLNPFEIINNAYSFHRGNPDLKPAYRNNVQFSYMFGQNLMTSIFYGSINDLIYFTPVEDDATQRFGTTYINFGRYQNISGSINYRHQIVKIWTASLFIDGGYIISTSGDFVNKGFAYWVSLNNTINLTPTLSAELSGRGNSRVHRGYIVVEPAVSFSVGLRQVLLKNKMSISVTVNDLFFTDKEKVNSLYENINYSMVSQYDSRYVNLTLRYNFGSTTVRAARSKQTGIEDETTRAGGR